MCLFVLCVCVALCNLSHVQPCTTTTTVNMLYYLSPHTPSCYPSQRQLPLHIPNAWHHYSLLHLCYYVISDCYKNGIIQYLFEVGFFTRCSFLEIHASGCMDLGFLPFLLLHSIPRFVWPFTFRGTLLKAVLNISVFKFLCDDLSSPWSLGWWWVHFRSWRGRPYSFPEWLYHCTSSPVMGEGLVSLHPLSAFNVISIFHFFFF